MTAIFNLVSLFIIVGVLSLASAGVTRAESADNLSERSLEELSNTGLSTRPKNLAVTTAAKYAQNSSQAPSALRVVTAEDVRTFGYRTLAEILRSLPGIYLTHDRNYTYIGLRGFGRPWDYNSRVLLLIDGERMNENISDGAFVANEFLVDVDLIERVEFMPGPGSAIYGNNAFLGVINVITRRGKDFNGGELSAEYGGFDTYKVRGTYGKRFDNGAEMLLSATGFDREGPNQLFFKEFNTAEQSQGKAAGLDYDRYQSTFGKFSWHAFTAEGGYIDRTKGIPTASYGQAFNESQSATEDSQGYVALSFDDQITTNWNLHLRVNYHQYDYRGNYIYAGIVPSSRITNRDLTFGEWWGGEMRAANTSFVQHKLVFGAELQDNLQQSLKNYDVGGKISFDLPYQSTRYGFYLQDEYSPWDSLTLIAGARYDYNPLGGSSANPRIGVIWQALNDTTFKLLYGTAFRAPNVVDQINTNRADPNAYFGLLPETIKTFEFIVDHAFTPATHFSASAYRYHIDKLIGPNSQDYSANLETVKAYGIELEGEQRFRNGIQARLSYVWQHAHDEHGKELSNSPHHQVKVHVSSPLWSEQWRAGLETLYFSDRDTLGGKVGDYVMGNLTVSGDLLKNIQFSAGVYNLLNAHYADPAGPSFRQDGIFQDGRSFRLKLNVRF